MHYWPIMDRRHTWLARRLCQSFIFIHDGIMDAWPWNKAAILNADAQTFSTYDIQANCCPSHNGWSGQGHETEQRSRKVRNSLEVNFCQIPHHCPLINIFCSHPIHPQGPLSSSQPCQFHWRLSLLVTNIILAKQTWQLTLLLGRCWCYQQSSSGT